MREVNRIKSEEAKKEEEEKEKKTEKICDNDADAKMNVILMRHGETTYI